MFPFDDVIILRVFQCFLDLPISTTFTVLRYYVSLHLKSFNGPFSFYDFYVHDMKYSWSLGIIIVEII